MQAALQNPALFIPGVWRGEQPRDAAPTEATGIRLLDEALRGGWTQSGLIQFTSRDEGFGLSLILPTLKRFTQAGRAVALIQTPYQPCAPAFASHGIDLKHLLWLQPKQSRHALWAFEQLLRSGLYAAVAYWGPALEMTTERRLQLAAEAGKGLAFCFQVGGEDAHSYAGVRLSLQPDPDGAAAIGVQVLKCRGARAGRRVRVRSFSPIPLLNAPQ